MKELKNIFVILVLACTLGQFFSDLYLPSIPAISKSLSASTSLTQFTISMYMLGYCISSFIYGSISDTFGRRKPLLIGLILCFTGSVICAISMNIYTVILGRLLQGLGAGSVTVAGAIIRDYCEGEKMAKFNSYLAIANIVVIMLAPFIGGYIQYFLNWRANFYFLLIYAFVILFLVFTFLPESKLPEYRSTFKFSTYKSHVIELLTSRQFVGYALCLFASYGGILAWLTVGPVLMQEYLFLPTDKFVWMFILCGAGYGVGAMFNARFINRFGTHKMIVIGNCIIALGGVSMLLLASMSYFNVAVIIVPMLTYTFGCAMIFPNSYACALSPFLRIAGVAAAILGGIQLLGGYLASMIMAFLPADSQVPLSLVLIISSAAVFIFYKAENAVRN